MCAWGSSTKFDFLKAFMFTTTQLVPHYQELMTSTVGSIMSKDVAYVEPEEPLTRALNDDRHARPQLSGAGAGP